MVESAEVVGRLRYFSSVRSWATDLYIAFAVISGHSHFTLYIFSVDFRSNERKGRPYFEFRMHSKNHRLVDYKWSGRATCDTSS